jgi:ATP-binding cassette, subfamily F, member 3
MTTTTTISSTNPINTTSNAVKEQLLRVIPMEMQNDNQLMDYLVRVVESLQETPLPVVIVERTLRTILTAAGLDEFGWQEFWKALYSARGSILWGRLLAEEDLGVGGVDLDAAAAVVPFERPVQMDSNEGTAVTISGSAASLEGGSSVMCPELAELLGGGAHASGTAASIDFLSNRKTLVSQVSRDALEKAEARLRQKAEKRSRKEAGLYRAGKFGPSGQVARSAAEREAERSQKVDAVLQEAQTGDFGLLRDIHMAAFDISLPKRILTDAECSLIYGRRYGLIGRNGVGKSTFLRHIASRQIPGIPGHISILHVEQEMSGDDQTALDAVLSADYRRACLLEEQAILSERSTSLELDFTPQDEERLSAVHRRLIDLDADRATSRAAMILAGLGFSQNDQKRPTRTFSGGWRMRLSLAQALFAQPDLLLLDEPTNMLDFPAVVWLQEYLLQWPGTILVVSHDRLFLDAVCSDIVHLHAEQLVSYRGDYTQFVATRTERLKNQQREYETQLAYRQHLQAFVDRWRYNANRAPQAQSRLKILEKLPELKPVVIDAPILFRFPKLDTPPPSPLVQLDQVDFAYESTSNTSKIILKNVSFNLNTDGRVAIVGPNGAGKTTLLKLLTGQLDPTHGRASLNSRLRVAYFSQHHVDGLNDAGQDPALSRTPLEWLALKYPGKLDEEYRRQLGSFGLSGPLALQSIETLSGGQKSRLVFAGLALNTPHLLILDEPTNHLDIDSIDALIEAIKVFNGAVIAVSHDKRFVDLIAKEIWVCANASVKQFEGSIHDYANSLLSSS